jgi:hypothetical protein
MALTPAWFMNGFRREGTPRPLLISTTRACGIFVLSWVVTTSLTGCATAHGPSRVDDRVMSPTWPWSRVAEFAEVVETFNRQAVAEIRGPVVARGPVPGTIIGGWLGFSLGVVPGLGGANAGLAWTSLAGAATLGGWLGNRWSTHAVDGVVYRAP